MASNRVYGAWCVLLLAVALATPAAATTVVMPTDEHLIEKSPVIVRGTVLSSVPVEIDGGIWTETRVAVDEAIKGNPGEVVTVREIGGRIADRETVVFGSPDYQAGESVLLFLWPSPRGDYQTMDLFLGKFTEEWTLDGQRLWFRPNVVPNTEILGSDFEPISDTADVQRQAAAFSSFVRDRVAGRAGDASYGVREPLLVRSVQSDFSMISEPTIYRWFAFQDGKSASWKGVGTQPGYGNGGVDDTKIALAAWSGYTEANIRYVWDGMSTSSPGGLDRANGINEVIFNDPLDEISGSWTGGGGVVGRGGFNRVSGARSWTSTFDADGTHTARTWSAYDVIEGNLVIQDGVSPSTGISSTRFAEIVAHEFGHTLGFGHSADTAALMYSSVSGRGPSLRDDDRVAARWLYPGSGGGGGGGSTTQIPAAPSNLSATVVTSTSVRLAWQDNSTAETLQTIYVDAGNGFVSAGTVGANVSSVDVTNLTSGRSYGFRVTASNSAGESSPSNIASVTLASDSVTASFSVSPTSGTAGVTTFAFTDSSTGPVASWQWSFGDGSSSTAKNPSKIYANAGTYTVTLTVRSSAGQQSTTSRAVTLGAAVVPVSASFSYSPSTGVAGTTFAFNDQSSGPVTSWQWSFGDGSSSTAQHPSKVYAAAGTYTVTLTVRGPSGQQSTTSRSISIGVAATVPVSAAFSVTPTSGTAGATTFSFADQSSGPVTSWQWSFGDGNGSTAQNPSKVYASAGTYTVTLTVRGSSGQMSTSSRAVSVTAPAPTSYPFQSLVPVSTAVGGVSGTSWRTSLTIFNASTFSVPVDVIYLPGAGQAPQTRRVQLSSGRSASWQNVLSELFGIPNGAGALHFETSSTSGAPDLRIASRTYTDSSNGTYGQFVGELEGASIPATLHLAGLAMNGTFRTNVGLVNRSGSTVTPTLSLYGASGALLGRTSIALAPRSFSQQSLAAIFPIVSNAPQDQMSIEVTSPVANAVTAYASIIDNVSQDPVFVQARPGTTDRTLYIAAVGRTAGASGTYWRSDVTLHNPGSAWLSATVRFLRSGQDNRSATGRTLQLAPRGTQTIQDVLMWAGAGDGSGALEISWSGPSQGIVATSRTYTGRGFDSGTLGQAIAMSSASEFSRRAIVTGLASDSRFRTNVGVVNSGDSQILVGVHLTLPDGRRAATAYVTVPARSQVQASVANLFPAVNAASIGQFTIVAETDAPTMFAYGSVVDNQSGDPIFVSGR